MSEALICDICSGQMRRADAYEVERPTACDVVEVCSPECLATLACGESREAAEHQVLALLRTSEATKPKRWWQR